MIGSEKRSEHTHQRRLRTAFAYYSLNVAYLPVMGRGIGKPVIPPTSRTRSANRTTCGPDVSPTDRIALVRRRFAIFHRPTMPLPVGQPLMHFRTFREPSLSTIESKRRLTPRSARCVDDRTGVSRSAIQEHAVASGRRFRSRCRRRSFLGPVGGGGGRDTVFAGGHPQPRPILGWTPHG